MLKSIKSVLVGLTEEGKNEASSALGYGLSLAHAAKAHLTVEAASLHLMVPYSVVSSFGPDLVAAENNRVSALADAVAERVRQDAALAGVPCSVETPQLSYRGLLDAFVAQARVHDLSVIDAEQSIADLDRDLIEAVLFTSGRPVVIVPPKHDAFTCRRIVVAWDGSSVAARAVGDAMPFLKAAEQVEIVSVVGEKDLSRSVSGSELAPHLARHGIEVTVKDIPAQHGDVAETFRQQVGIVRADMLVMGGYKHSRLTEWVLGGVTRSLLGSSPVPLFMSH